MRSLCMEVRVGFRHQVSVAVVHGGVDRIRSRDCCSRRAGTIKHMGGARAAGNLVGEDRARGIAAKVDMTRAWQLSPEAVSGATVSAERHGQRAGCPESEGA